MSNFLHKGKRTSTIKRKTSAKKHIKKMYKILGELDFVAKAMIKSGEPIKESNVVQEAAKYTNREIGSYEKNILLNKVNEVYDKLGLKIKDKK